MKLYFIILKYEHKLMHTFFPLQILSYIDNIQ
jgi:hypothetical protein